MSASSVTSRSDFQLWLTAILLSLGVNLLVVLALALMVIRSWIFAVPDEVVTAPPEEQRIIEIVPVTRAEETPAEEEAGPRDRPFVRSSADQATDPVDDARFIGENDTRAASDADPVAGAPDLPSQAGIEPRTEGEMEFTESDYQDGDLAHEADGGMAEPLPREADPVEPGEAGEPPVAEAAEGEGEIRVEETQPPTDRLLEGPMTVDRPVPMEQVEEEPKPAPRPAEPEVVEQQVKPQPTPRDPGFRGNQQKTRLSGSISRSGESSLDVENTELGRYHAALSRAIEQAWQRKMFENRDVLMPGVLRLQIVLDANGRVRSVSAVDEVGGSRIQRGLTIGAVREADLPDLPAGVKRELDGEPLELLYNFIF